jgi:hypothetical protein
MRALLQLGLAAEQGTLPLSAPVAAQPDASPAPAAAPSLPLDASRASEVLFARPK